MEVEAVEVTEAEYVDGTNDEVRMTSLRNFSRAGEVRMELIKREGNDLPFFYGPPLNSASSIKGTTRERPAH
jgi:hypothetical protein